MAQKPEDFNLPLSAIRKILQDSMPPDVIVSDRAKLALSKAASVFILYVTTAANVFSQDNKRKRLLGKDVLTAITDLDMSFLVPPLTVTLSEYHQDLHSKKQAKGDEKRRDSGTHVPEEIIILDSESDDDEGTANNSNSENSSSSSSSSDDVTIL